MHQSARFDAPTHRCVRRTKNNDASTAGGAKPPLRPAVIASIDAFGNRTPPGGWSESRHLQATAGDSWNSRPGGRSSPAQVRPGSERKLDGMSLSVRGSTAGRAYGWRPGPTRHHRHGCRRRRRPRSGRDPRDNSLQPMEAVGKAVTMVAFPEGHRRTGS